MLGVEPVWNALGKPKAPGVHAVSSRRSRIAIPHCNGRERVLVDGAVRDPGSKGPLVVRARRRHDARRRRSRSRSSTYEKRIACSEPARVGAVVRATDGLSLLRFTSPHRRRAAARPSSSCPAVTIARGRRAPRRPHPWNGSPWTYAAYKELIEEAGKKDVVLLMPSGLGNSLYVADAEDEVMRAIDARRRGSRRSAARLDLGRIDGRRRRDDDRVPPSGSFAFARATSATASSPTSPGRAGFSRSRTSTRRTPPGAPHPRRGRSHLAARAERPPLRRDEGTRLRREVRSRSERRARGPLVVRFIRSSSTTTRRGTGRRCADCY